MATRKEQLQQKLKDIQAEISRINAKEAKEERAKDTRRKILIGAFVQWKMKNDIAYEQSFMKELGSYLKSDRDRKVFDLPPLPKEQPKDGNLI